jgi:hypothetical protein
MEVCVKAALDYIRVHINPKVVIAHDGSREDPFFWKAIKERTEQRRISLIGLSGRAREVMWMSHLDSDSLKGKPRHHLSPLV